MVEEPGRYIPFIASYNCFTMYYHTAWQEKALDTAPREIYENKNVGIKLLRAIKSLNTSRTNNQESNDFVTNMGVRQDSVLSPASFITLMGETAKEWRIKLYWEYKTYSKFICQS